jgi:hypothetical protein
MAGLLVVALTALLLEDDHFVGLYMAQDARGNRSTFDNGGADGDAVLVFAEQYAIKREFVALIAGQTVNVHALVFLHFVLQPCYFYDGVHVYNV